MIGQHQSSQGWMSNTSANRSVFEGDGTLRFDGTATVWQDIPPIVGVYNRTFAGTTSNTTISLGWELPHSYKLGSSIYPHLHLAFVSGINDIGNTIVFDLTYSWFSVYETGTPSSATITGNYTITENQTTYNNLIFKFTGTGSGSGNNAPIANTGQGLSSIITAYLIRRQDIDTFVGNVAVVSLGLHIEADMVGSRLEYTK